MPEADTDSADPPLCEWCGFPIEEDDQQCMAREPGWICDPDPYPDEPPVDLRHCEWCGAEIEDANQQCYARDDGVTCHPDPYGEA